MPGAELLPAGVSTQFLIRISQVSKKNTKSLAVEIEQLSCDCLIWFWNASLDTYHLHKSQRVVAYGQGYDTKA
jgi:hypothetical protein